MGLDSLAHDPVSGFSARRMNMMALSGCCDLQSGTRVGPFAFARDSEVDLEIGQIRRVGPSRFEFDVGRQVGGVFVGSQGDAGVA